MVKLAKFNFFRQLQYARDDAFFTLWLCAPLLRELQEQIVGATNTAAMVLEMAERSWATVDAAVSTEDGRSGQMQDLGAGVGI